MNAWLLASAALLLGFVPCTLVCLRGSRVEAVIAVQLAGTLTTLALITLAAGFDRPSYYELPPVFALVSFIGSLVFVRLMERRL